MPKGVFVRRCKPIKDRLLRKVAVQESGCWLWTGTVNNSGYGTIGLGPASLGKDFAHRVSYREHKGPIPPGMVVRHKCDVKRCVNPDHLELGTYLENSRDIADRGRVCAGERWNTPAREQGKPKGERHGMAKLSVTQVLQIRRLGEEGKTKAEIAKRFDVSRATVRNILTGKNWGHLKEES